MPLHPFTEPGLPLQEQLRARPEEEAPDPYDPETVHPFTRSRILLAEAVESEAASFSHRFSRDASSPEIRRLLAVTRRVEQAQQERLSLLVPAGESAIALAIGYEQAAVELTARFALEEPDPYVRQALEFALLEDFDHLYRFANLLRLLTGREAGGITGGLTEITVGRPTLLTHRHPFDEVRLPHDRSGGDMLTPLRLLALLALEQRKMSFYRTVGNRLEERIARTLFFEVARIEEQHVTHYGSLLRRTPRLEGLAHREYVECWLYHRFAREEEDPRIREIFRDHLASELSHLQAARERMRRSAGRDPLESLPRALPASPVFASNIDFVRSLLSSRVFFNAFESEFRPTEECPRNEWYDEYQDAVRAGEVPSVDVVGRVIARDGVDYRQELRGPHPVWMFRQERPGKAA